MDMELTAQSKNSPKEIAVAFEQLLADGRIREAFDKYVRIDFRHHNPFYKEGREGLLIGMEKAEPQFSDKAYEVLQVLEDGNFVVIHSKLIPKPSWKEMSVIRLYRFEDGKIAEQWDVGQQEPDNSLNKDGLF